MLRTAWLVPLIVAACGDDAMVTPDAAPDAGPGPGQDIGFQPRQPLTSGSWLLANDWASDPNLAFVIPTSDLAAPKRELFAANRVWAFGTTADASTIWFSAFDEAQEQHFGVTFGDSIQNTFAFDPASQSVRWVAPGGWANVNDECHAPSADGSSLYVCRRNDFVAGGAFTGWRIGRFDLATGAFAFLRDSDGAGAFELAPQELPGGTHVLFELRNRPPATGSSIQIRELSSGTERMVLTGGTRPTLAPDGHRVLYRDTASRTYKIKDLDQAGAAVEISATRDPGDAVWSPDGNTIIYSVFDQDQSCDHLERVTATGGGWSAPVRVRDCGTTGEFITNLAWITVP